MASQPPLKRQYTEDAAARMLKLAKGNVEAAAQMLTDVKASPFIRRSKLDELKQRIPSEQFEKAQERIVDLQELLKDVREDREFYAEQNEELKAKLRELVKENKRLRQMLR